jgi:hypothetical protein
VLTRDAESAEAFSWMRDHMMPALREKRAQACHLRHQVCSDALSGRCSMLALVLIEEREELRRDAYRWLDEIQKANKERRDAKTPDAS